MGIYFPGPARKLWRLVRPKPGKHRYPETVRHARPGVVFTASEQAYYGTPNDRLPYHHFPTQADIPVVSDDPDAKLRDVLNKWRRQIERQHAQ